jgi:hypothetical protein
MVLASVLPLVPTQTQTLVLALHYFQKLVRALHHFQKLVLVL